MRRHTARTSKPWSKRTAPRKNDRAQTRTHTNEDAHKEVFAVRYIPHNADDIRIMLEKIGAASVDELFEVIPEALRLKGELALPAPLSESELMAQLEARMDCAQMARSSFLGAGLYHHHLPPAVDQLLLRSEFYTAYTAYQPEVSQGTLQAIFEFQTMMCRIFGTGIANASMYDGASALAEAALMARRYTQRSRIVVSRGIHPEYIETLLTYLNALDDDQPDVVFVDLDDQTGETNWDALDAALTPESACVLVGYPNFVGVVEPLDKIAALAQSRQVPLITSTTDILAFGLLKPPGALGADICTGEGQSVSAPPSFGGPGVGLFTIRDDRKLLRQMPGRLVGKTVDVDGKPGYVLTLSTREQHIRREKATSNICTNHGLVALSAAIHLSLLGASGFSQLANICFSRAQYLKQALAQIPGLRLRWTGPTFHEFAVACDTLPVSELLDRLTAAGIHGGVALERFGPAWRDTFLVAVTELNTRDDLDRYIATLRDIVPAA